MRRFPVQLTLEELKALDAYHELAASLINDVGEAPDHEIAEAAQSAWQLVNEALASASES